MKNSNQEYFRKIYPKIWLNQRAQREVKDSHYQYQEIMLDSLHGQDGLKTMELGCGCGELLERLDAKYPGSQLYGMDLGRDSLLSAKINLKGIPFQLVEGDITALPFPESSFDRVLSSSVLWYVKNPEFAIREMIRILKPSGLFVFDVRNLYHITNIMAAISLHLKRTFLKKQVPDYSFYTPKSISTLMESLPVKFKIVGYFVLMPTRLPVVGIRWGNWASHFPWLSFNAGHGLGSWLSLKLMVTGYKIK